MSKLDAAQLSALFERQGFIILRNYLSTGEVAGYRTAIDDAVMQLHTESGLNADGLVFHSNLFRLSAALAQSIAAPKIASVVEAVSGAPLWVRWDQQISKHPGGVVFPWHRDNAYNKLKAEHFQCWIPLTEMTPENGALWLQPGSHRWEETEHHKKDNHWVASCDDAKAICLEASPGDLVLFSSRLFHKTGVNTSQQPRIAYVVEYMKQVDFDPGIEAPYLFIDNHLPRWLSKHPYKGPFWRPSKGIISGKDLHSKRKV